ncbi:MAG: hypothetical protein PHU23_01225 [Dehalococcoidales bacterium]|nr:hypothetical protein [Dehalococcoidales bacterium]
MSEIAIARINTFGSKSPKADFVSPDDPILEIPLSEFQHVLDDMISVYNQIAETVRDTGILRGRELARLTESHTQALRAERSPITKILLLNAYIRQLLTKIRDALKIHPTEGSKVVQVCSKVMARAVQIVEYVKTITQDSPRKEIALDSQQARILFQGASGEPVSRKETIRAMKRAEALWPALRCGHRPNDGRQTTRLTAKVEELKDSPIMGYRDLWQRSERNVGLSI